MKTARRVTVDSVMAAERAASFTKRSIKASTKKHLLKTALSMLDLTTLEGKDSAEKVRGLCRKAIRPYERDEEVLGERLPSCGAVCVYPSLVPTCVEAFRGATSLRDIGEDLHYSTSLRDVGEDLHGATFLRDVGKDTHAPEERATTKLPNIASVATGFPSGQYPLDVRLRDVRDAVAAGADEIDMVISRGLFLAGKIDEVAEEIRQTKRACQREDGSFAHLKVILETGELETLDNVRRASDLAIRAMDEVSGATLLRSVPPACTTSTSSKPPPAKSSPPRRCPSRL
jgi:deoxyribose-phosphate aldolase